MRIHQGNTSNSEKYSDLMPMVKYKTENLSLITPIFVTLVKPDYAGRRRSKRSKIDKDRNGLADPIRTSKRIEADPNLENSIFIDPPKKVSIFIDPLRYLSIFIDLLIREYESANSVFVTFYLFHFQDRRDQGWDQ